VSGATVSRGDAQGTHGGDTQWRPQRQSKTSPLIDSNIARALLKCSLKPNGALWVIRPKGRPEISERAVMDAGKAAGLVDVKVVSFSPTHTAEKFVIPIAKR